VSVRLGFDRATVVEFYDLCGSHRFEHGRPLFYRATSYDALIFAHDVTDPATRSALSRVWIPEAMSILGNTKVVDAGGRLESAGPHARSRGVLNELRLLWLHARSKHARVRAFDAIREASRLVGRFLRLILNEYNIWTDERIDCQAERDLLSTTPLPIAIVGLKQDLADFRDRGSTETAKTVSAFTLCAFDGAEDPAMVGFLRRAVEHSQRKSSVALSRDGISSTDIELSL
jgi:hypothetical protein